MSQLQNKTRFKALHLVKSDQKRGAEVFASQLASRLSRGRFDNALCIIHPTPGGNLACEGARTFVLGGNGGLFGGLDRDVSNMWHLRRVMNEFQPDILLAHGSDTVRYGAVMRALHRECVAIYRNIGVASAWAKSSMKAYLNRRLLNRFDAVVSLSQTTRRDFLQVYKLPSDRVFVIPNSVDGTPYVGLEQPSRRSEYRQRLGLVEDSFVLITVGSLAPEKNQAQLVSLVHQLRQEGTQVKLIVVGDGPLRESLEGQIERLGISDSVMLLGVRDDVPALLAAADLFVLSSETEAVPAVLIEAGLAGLASVAYDVGAIADVIEDGVTGVVVHEGNYEGFKEAVIGLQQDSEKRKTMGTTARKLCMDRFDIGRVADSYEELFFTLLDDRTGRGDNVGRQGVAGRENVGEAMIQGRRGND